MTVLLHKKLSDTLQEARAWCSEHNGAASQSGRGEPGQSAGD